MFCYGGLLFALAQYAYLAYLDQGYMLMVITEMLSTAETAELINQMGMTDQISESLHVLQNTRPIDFALNTLMTVVLSGTMLGMPIAAVMQKKEKEIK